MLTAEQSRRYFESRLPDLSRRKGSGSVTVRCVFHDDKTGSLSVDPDKGVWKCHAGAGCGEGGVIAFEQKFSGCDPDTARANIAELLGEPRLFNFAQKPEAIYEYQDATGKLLFQKLRYPGKRFPQRQPDGKGGWIYKLYDGPKPLYRLPEVLVANSVIICEGEKDADNVRALNLSNRDKNWFVAVTTNFDGAGKWRDEYSIFLAGKRVVIFSDNDEAGRNHAQQVAASVHKYATGVKLVNLPGLPPKGDVSDYLESHTAAELLEEIKSTSAWFPDSPNQPKVLVPVPKFAVCSGEEITWMVEGILERGANGVICAEPKVGKSWLAIELALCLSLGVDFLGFRVPRPVKVAFVSREDNPPLTAWRIRHLFADKAPENPSLLETNLWINTRQQSKQLLLDNPEQMAELLADLRIVRPEFLILDVLNTLHTKDENDNTEMRKVFAGLDELQREIGCGIGVVHHYNKTGSGSMTQRMRGSSAIAGWCEWMIGIEIEDAERKVRKMQFELKAAQPPEPIYWVITSGQGVATLKKVPRVEETHGRVQ